MAASIAEVLSMRRSWTEVERTALVAAFQVEGRDLEGFARRHGVPVSTLWYWLRRARKRGGATALVPQLVEVVVDERAAAPRPAAGCRLVVGGGAELVLEELPPAHWVAELARELARC